MLVKFTSSVSGEIIMFAEAAHALLTLLGKECGQRGVFVRDEMLAAAVLLRKHAEAGDAPSDEDSEERPVTLDRRAWPLIDMLERTAKGDQQANIVWQAARDF